MSLAASHRPHVDADWFRSPHAQDLLFTVLDRSTQKRKHFGLLEGPSIPPQLQLEQVTYKLFLVGRAGVGKTCTIAKLAGTELPEKHFDTPGVEVTRVYWPARIADDDRLVMFNLEFWDAGDLVTRDYQHILPALKENADGAVLVFSYTDKSSFDDLSSLMARVFTPTDTCARLIIGTKFDQQSKSEVTNRDMKEFESVHQLPILRIKNIPVFHPGGRRSDLAETAPILNTICDQLWRRDAEAGPSTGAETYV